MPAPIPLRGHHFLCMLTYKGHGYTPAFVARMDETMAEIASGHPVVLTHGPDHLCVALTEGCGHEGHCREARTVERDDRAIASLASILPLQNGAFLITSDQLATLRELFASGAIRAACHDCEWMPLCDQIVAEGFDGVRLSHAVAGSVAG
jgi:uncharacterized protein